MPGWLHPPRLSTACLALIALIGLGGCVTSRGAVSELPPPPPSAVARPVSLPPLAPRRHQEIASWYGPGFNGRLTSSGERYNENALTAASKTLPIGSRVRVINPENGKSVEVRINDRGPHKRGRTMDLSRRAAQKLGITRKGVARVEVVPVMHKPHHHHASPPAPPPHTETAEE
jgi:rare lipoprotein A